jgi:hypothetical protein
MLLAWPQKMAIHQRRRELKFLCLGYFDRQKMDALSKAQIDAVMGESAPHITELYGSGKVIIDAGLDVTARRLQRVDGQLQVGDGALAHAQEMIGCALLVEADDMADAVRIAALHPTTRLAAGEQLGWRMEVRPIHHFATP